MYSLCPALVLKSSVMCNCVFWLDYDMLILLPKNLLTIMTGLWLLFYLEDTTVSGISKNFGWLQGAKTA